MIGLHAGHGSQSTTARRAGMLDGMVVSSFELVPGSIPERSRNEVIPKLRSDKFSLYSGMIPNDANPISARWVLAAARWRESFAIRNFRFFVDCLYQTTRPKFPSLSHDRANLQPNRTCLGAVYIRSIHRSCFALFHTFVSITLLHHFTASSHGPICNPGTRGSRCQRAEAPTKASLIRMVLASPKRVPVSCCT